MRATVEQAQTRRQGDETSDKISNATSREGVHMVSIVADSVGVGLIPFAVKMRLAVWQAS